ncbi:MAG: PQQ-binding-like beta-propeller repeat protein [Gemmataceae bacterium]
MVFLACLLLVNSADPIAPADSWPEFRGPTGDGIANSLAKPPTQFGETKNLRWKVPIHDLGWSSPVVAGNQIWLTTATKFGTDYYAICIDRITGKTAHDLKLFHHSKPTDITRFNTYASPTPVLAEGKLFVHFGTFGTACVDPATGKTIWERTDIECNHFRGPASSPVYFNGKLYLLFDGFDRQFVICLDAANGKTVWQKDRDLPYRNSGKPEVDNDYKKAFATASIVMVAGKPQLVAPAAMGTIAYDPATGDEIWRVITDGMNQASRPVLANGLVYVTAGNLSTLFAIKPDGHGNITKSHVAFKKEKIAPTRPSPLVVGDTLFFVNDTGIMVALNAKTGQEFWKESLGDKFSSSPIVANGMIYLGSEAGTMFVIKAGKTYEPIAKIKLDDPIRASPAAVGKDLIVRTYSNLYCFEAK